MEEEPRLSALFKRDLYQILEPDGEVAAEANLEVRMGARWLTNLWVKHTHQRKGIGRQMLTQVVADFGNELLFLHVLAYDGRPMADDKLLLFYQSFGFIQTEAPGVLKRLPA